MEYYNIATHDEAEDEEDHGYVINTIHQYEDICDESQAIESECSARVSYRALQE